MRKKTVEPHQVLLLSKLDSSVTPSAAAAAMAEPGTRDVPVDISLRLLVNSEPLVTLLCLNQGCEDLALGFLYTEGLLESRSQVTRLEFHEDLYVVEIDLDHELDRGRLESTRSMTTGCGRGVTYVDPAMDELFRPVAGTARIRPSELWASMAELSRLSEMHRDVGGVHSALFQGSQGSVMAEDIGRHNCVDRIAGVLLRRSPPGSAERPGAGGRVFSTGRISSEILTKCVRLGVEIVVSRSSPTTSALRLAEDFNLTVVGYARGGRAVVYTGRERIDVDAAGRAAAG